MHVLIVNDVESIACDADNTCTCGREQVIKTMSGYYPHPLECKTFMANPELMVDQRPPLFDLNRKRNLYHIEWYWNSQEIGLDGFIIWL